MTQSKKIDPQTELAEAVQSLVVEVQVLRMAVDELTEEVKWGNRNRRTDRLGTDAHRRITSCSLDPTSPTFQVNPVPEETLAELRAEVSTKTKRSQQTLFG